MMASEKIIDGQIIQQGENFKEGTFWTWISKFCNFMGKAMTKKILQLYYIMKKDDVPQSTKILIMGFLAYLVATSCSIPFLGFMVDCAVIGIVLKQVIKYIDDDVMQKVDRKMQELYK